MPVQFVKGIPKASMRQLSFRSAVHPVFLAGFLAHWSLVAISGVEFPLRWRWSNPQPHGNNIIAMAFSEEINLAVQVTELGQVYSSSDLRLWTPRDSGTDLNLRAVTFFGSDPPRVVVTGEAGTVLFADALQDFQTATLVDGPTQDWLEAVAASPDLLVAVGDEGAIYSSVDGETWKRQTAPEPSSTWMRGVAYGQGTFVAVGEGGYIIRSVDGTNWIKRASGTMQNLNRVSFGGGYFTAVAGGGLALSSTNAGMTWFPEATGAAGTLHHAAMNPSARLLVGNEEVRLQTGLGWSDEFAKSNAPPVWHYFCALQRPDYFLVAGRTGVMAEGFRTNSNPYFWIESGESHRHLQFDMMYASNLFVSVGDRASVMTSGNGIDWNLELVPQSLTNSIFLGVGGTTNLLIAAGNDGSLMISPNIMTNLTVVVGTNGLGQPITTNVTVSSLGVLWSAIQPRPTQNDLQGVTYGHGLYVVTGDNGYVMTSADGTNWTEQSTPTARLLSGVTAWPGGFVAVGDEGAALVSADGKEWTAVPSNTSNWLYKVRYLDGLLIAVGQGGTVCTSLDGRTWQARTSSTTAWLNDVTKIEDTFFVAGTQGTLLTSSNAVDWVSRGLITGKSLYSAATDGAYLVVAGVEGVILRSPVLPNLNPVKVLSYARVTSENVPDLIQNIYLFAGTADQQFTLDRSMTLLTPEWATGTLLEFFSSDGTLFYLENILESKSPEEEYYQAVLVP